MNSIIKPSGRIEVYRVRNDILTKVYDHKNSINSVMRQELAESLISRSNEMCVDAIAWGSFSAPGGTFVDSNYAGTTGSGTQGNLIMGRILSIATFSGTFTFSTTKRINMFRMGDGYIAAGAGVTELFTNLYAYDSTLLTGSTWLEYLNGDALILNWSITVA